MRKLRGFHVLALLLALFTSTASADPSSPRYLPEPPKPHEPIVIDTVQPLPGEMLCEIYQGASTGYCGGDPVNRTDPMGTDWYYTNVGNQIVYKWFEGSGEHAGYTHIGAEVWPFLGFFESNDDFGIYAKQILKTPSSMRRNSLHGPRGPKMQQP